MTLEAIILSIAGAAIALLVARTLQQIDALFKFVREQGKECNRLGERVTRVEERVDHIEKGLNRADERCETRHPV